MLIYHNHELVTVLRRTVSTPVSTGWSESKDTFFGVIEATRHPGRWFGANVRAHPSRTPLFAPQHSPNLDLTLRRS